MSNNPVRVFGTIDRFLFPEHDWRPGIYFGITMYEGREYYFGVNSFLDWNGSIFDPGIPKLGQRISFEPWIGSIRNSAEEIRRETA
ncbi:hypothetical protein [Pseudomonas vancouverensis]|uniref:Uncharacterized protein n=1 Tax=Pseudomonas vancouverensis TaxID=95300 RepID=A0A1H2P4J2_PSEVA|nr:hypothetical protein [Pseudomonas vancouverensis]KAB0499712.1 hypothetical protein F7R09_00670 [Pseudomonas vancouverensis]TDB56701.1 hypothetical protein EIY72_28315 [Pseudomonas vancouverensis]SDV12301.1 hypothetical protein SAMN05216558_3577 [Pseudomonas vancouverensis]